MFYIPSVKLIISVNRSSLQGQFGVRSLSQSERSVLAPLWVSVVTVTCRNTGARGATPTGGRSCRRLQDAALPDPRLLPAHLSASGPGSIGLPDARRGGSEPVHGLRLMMTSAVLRIRPV